MHQTWQTRLVDPLIFRHAVALTAQNWQKWKRVLLTCPCHENRDEAVGLQKKMQLYMKNYDFCEYVEFGAISWKFDILSIAA